MTIVPVDLRPDEPLHFWTISEFAKRWQVTRMTVDRWLASGALPCLVRPSAGGDRGRRLIFPEHEQMWLDGKS